MVEESENNRKRPKAGPEMFQKNRIMQAILDAQEKERREVSFVLHDDVTQILASCKLFLEMARKEATEAEQYITQCGMNLQRAIDKVRNISWNLTPYALKDLGLQQAVREIVSRNNNSSKLQISLKISAAFSEAAIPWEIQLACFRIVQEQISNICKHSDASAAKIGLVRMNNELTLSIIDNGVGFDRKNTQPGLGLYNMQNRVEFYHGSFKVNTRQGKGCRIKIKFPL